MELTFTFSNSWQHSCSFIPQVTKYPSRDQTYLALHLFILSLHKLCHRLCYPISLLWHQLREKPFLYSKPFWHQMCRFSKPSSAPVFCTHQLDVPQLNSTVTLSTQNWHRIRRLRLSHTKQPPLQMPITSLDLLYFWQTEKSRGPVISLLVL